MKRLILFISLLACFSFCNIYNPVSNASNLITGILPPNQTTKTSSYTASTEEYIFCDATSAAIVITLPAVSKKLKYTIKKIDSSANLVTVSGNASETIDGELTQVLTTQYDVISVVGTATGWVTL